MAYPSIPENVQSQIRRKFEAADSSKDLNYYSTEVTVIKINGVPFQLRFSPALAHKPTAKDGSKDHKRPFDPFENPPKELFICDLPPSHYLVLNKFAIIPEHFILATKDFKEQTDILEEADIAAVHALLTAWEGTGKELFAFFNSGPHSGASQRHRHVQFLPVEGMRIGLSKDETWDVLLDDLAHATNVDLPFRYFVASIPEHPTPEQLYAIYASLYEQACQVALSWNPDNSGNALGLEGSGTGNAMMSYNLGVTKKTMILCPRRAEGVEIFGGKDGEGKGYVALNGTLLAGTLLVKNEMEWDALKNDERQLGKVLEAIGFPVPVDAGNFDGRQCSVKAI